MMRDSLQAFREVSHNNFLENTQFILFLNKKDIFVEKLKVTCLSSCFPQYEGMCFIVGVSYCAYNKARLKNYILSLVFHIVLAMKQESKATFYRWCFILCLHQNKTLNYILSCMQLKMYRSISVMWLGCRFFYAEVDDSNPGSISMLCP